MYTLISRNKHVYYTRWLLTGCGCTWYHHPDSRSSNIRHRSNTLVQPKRLTIRYDRRVYRGLESWVYSL